MTKTPELTLPELLAEGWRAESPAFQRDLGVLLEGAQAALGEADEAIASYETAVRLGHIR